MASGELTRHKEAIEERSRRTHQSRLEIVHLPTLVLDEEAWDNLNAPPSAYACPAPPDRAHLVVELLRGDEVAGRGRGPPGLDFSHGRVIGDVRRVGHSVLQCVSCVRISVGIVTTTWMAMARDLWVGRYACAVAVSYTPNFVLAGGRNFGAPSSCPVTLGASSLPETMTASPTTMRGRSVVAKGGLINVSKGGLSDAPRLDSGTRRR
jgi:hypothetical protein